MAQIEINEEISNIVSVEVPEEGDQAEIHEAGVTSAMVANDQGRDPAKAYIAATTTGDINGMIDNWNQSTTEDRTAMMQGYLDISSVDQLKQEAEQFYNDMSGENGILGPYVQKIKSMPSSVGQSEEAIKEQALLTYHRQALAQFHPSSIKETIADVGGIFIPKRKAEAVLDIVKDMGFVEDTIDQAGVFIDPTDELIKMRSIGASLRGEEKAQYIQLVSNAVAKSTDNNLVKSEIMEAIFGGEGISDLETTFELLDLAAIGEAGVLAVKAGKNLSKAGSILNSYRRLDAPDSAAEVITRASIDPDSAARLGVSQADTGDAVNPLINGHTADILEGAPEDMSAQITHMIELQNERFRVVTEGLEREGVLDRDRMDELMRAAEIKQMEQPGVTAAKVVEKDETGFTLEYTTSYFDEAGKTTVSTERKTVDFHINQTGKIESPIEEYHLAVNRLDPNARMSGRLRNWFVHTVEKLARTQEKTAFSFDNMMRDAYRGLKKKNAAKVDHVLIQGAKEGRDYTYEDLVNVGIGPNRVKLKPQEAKAYFGVRNVVNHMYSLKNKQIVDNYLALGVKLVDNFDGIIPSRVFDDVDSALKNWSSIQSDSRWINVSDDGLRVGQAPVALLKLKNKGELTRGMLEEAYEAGYVLAKNHSSSHFFKRGEYNTQWALVRKDTVVSPRGQQVLNRLPGYIPKQRTNANYFIKRNRKGILSGADDSFEVGETVAWSDNVADADAWIAAQDDPSKFVKVFDRELPPEQQLAEISATHGGMYSGARKTTELPFVGSGKGEFADSFEAMQHYINHIGRQYPASLYRLGSEQRLIAVAESLGVKGATGLHDVLEKAVIAGYRAPAAGIKGSKEYELLKDIHDQVSFINMIPTDAELSMAKRMERIGNAMELPLLAKIPGWSKVPKFFYNKASEASHPADIIRGLTFNHLLGMYNPAQILVQFSGAMVSFAVSPLHSLKVMPKALVGWSTLDLSMGDPRTQKRVMKWMRQNNLGDYADDYELWSKSGYRESVINGNADYTSVFMKNMPYDAGILRKMLMNHTIFYKMGELANTRVAFATAIERYKTANKIKKVDPNDSKALDSISKDAEALRLNMSRANQSDLNKGWKSVPFQFQQVIAKYFEKLLPSTFGGTDELTSAEKFRLLAVPTALTGVAGIPLGQAVTVQLMEMLGVDETDLTPEQTQAMKFGGIGYMMQEHMDLNVDFASRMTLGGDVLKKAFEALTGSRSLWQWLGASSTVADRYFRNGQYLAEAFDLSIAENDEITMDSLKFMASVLKDAAMDIPTLSRNYKQYVSYFFTQNPQFIRDGKYMFDLDTMNNRTAFFAIAGFQPQEISEIYEIDKEINDGRAAFTLFGETDADIIRRVLNTHILNDTSSVEHKALGAQMVNSILKKYGVMEASQLMNSVWEKAYNKRYDQDDLLIKFLMESETRMQDGLDVFNTMISRKLQEQRAN